MRSEARVLLMVSGMRFGWAGAVLIVVMGVARKAWMPACAGMTGVGRAGGRGG